MPFTDGYGGISGRLQGLGDGDFLQGEVHHIVGIFQRGSRSILNPLISLNGNGMGNMQSPGVFACQQAGPCGSTDRRGSIRTGKLHSLFSQAINIRGFIIFAAKTSHIAVSHIVHQEEYEIGFGFLSLAS